MQADFQKNKKKGLLSEFIWDGNRDYSPWLTTPLIVDFWNSIDKNALNGMWKNEFLIFFYKLCVNFEDYTKQLSNDVEAMLCGAWAVKPYLKPRRIFFFCAKFELFFFISLCPSSLESEQLYTNIMRLIQLPIKGKELNSSHAKSIQDKLVKKKKHIYFKNIKNF